MNPVGVFITLYVDVETPLNAIVPIAVLDDVAITQVLEPWLPVEEHVVSEASAAQLVGVMPQ